MDEVLKYWNLFNHTTGVLFMLFLAVKYVYTKDKYERLRYLMYFVILHITMTYYGFK